MKKSNALLNLKYLKTLTLSVIRIYKIENPNINSYDKSILENINNLSEDKLCSIIISIELVLSLCVMVYLSSQNIMITMLIK